MGNLCCCIQVDQSTVAIKERFGKFEEVLEPGCHCLPWFLGSQMAGHLSLRLQQLDVKCETKTKVSIFYIFFSRLCEIPMYLDALVVCETILIWWFGCGFRTMCLWTWWRRSSTERLLIRRTMPSTNSPTPGVRFRPMCLMVYFLFLCSELWFMA